MAWFILKYIFSTIISFFHISRLSTFEKDLEILILRQQLAIVQRKLNSPIRPNRIEKLTLAVLTVRLKHISKSSTQQLRSVIRIFQPETVLRWHRELVRRKWTYKNGNTGGRPPTNKALENLIIRLAKENLRWGYIRIQGELIKLGFWVSPSTIDLLQKYSIIEA